MCWVPKPTIPTEGSPSSLSALLRSHPPVVWPLTVSTIFFFPTQRFRRFLVRAEIRTQGVLFMGRKSYSTGVANVKGNSSTYTCEILPLYAVVLTLPTLTSQFWFKDSEESLIDQIYCFCFIMNGRNSTLHSVLPVLCALCSKRNHKNEWSKANKNANRNEWQFELHASVQTAAMGFKYRYFQPAVGSLDSKSPYYIPLVM